MKLHVLDFSPLSRLCRNVLLKSLRILADLQNVALPYNDLALQQSKASSHFQPQQFDSSTISDTLGFGISSQPLLLHFL